MKGVTAEAKGTTMNMLMKEQTKKIKKNNVVCKEVQYENRHLYVLVQY